MMSEKYNSPSVVDQYRNLETNPEAKAFPVSTPRKIKEEPLKESKSSASNSGSNSGSNERLGKMTERLGGSRVGFTVPDISNRKGGVIKMAKGGSVKSSASRRGDGCASKGKTKGRMV
jgi:hypothetical protein